MKTRIIGITLGDVNGIGPEVSLRAAHRRWPAGTRIVLIGSARVVQHTCKALGYPVPAETSLDTPPARKITTWDPTPSPAPRLRPGMITVDASRAAHDWICATVQACLDGRLDAMVTAPICKEGFQRSGFTTPGHTELLAQKTRTRNYAMMLFGGGLRVVLLTRHIPLREVPESVTVSALRATVQLTSEALPWLGCRDGSIAVCGLNPHAGENGALGTEEKTIITPTLRRLRRAGHKVDGPIPGDTAFHRALQGDYDAVIAMYHDQGLAPLKTVAFDCGVNVTLGLPVIRTSPDHGTAFGLAGRGVASASSMVAAVQAARDLAGRKNPWRPRSAQR